MFVLAGLAPVGDVAFHSRGPSITLIIGIRAMNEESNEEEQKKI